MINKVYGLLGLMARARKITYGADACLEEIKKKKIKLVLVAEDASEKTKKNFRYYCTENQIPIVFYGEIDNLSKAIGKSNKAIIGIKDSGVAQKIQKMIDGGEAIG